MGKVKKKKAEYQKYKKKSICFIGEICIKKKKIGIKKKIIIQDVI